MHQLEKMRRKTFEKVKKNKKLKKRKSKWK